MSIIATWSDKGGTGKTTLSTSLACCFASGPLPLYDLDPQRDAARWAARRDIPCTSLGVDDARQFLQDHADSPELVVVDLPPGVPGLTIAALAEVCLVPTRPGDADLVALGRALKQLNRARQAGNPDLKIGVVLTQARVGTVRTETVEQALRVMAEMESFAYLGRLSHRVQIESAGASGQDLLRCGDGAVVHEFRCILSGISELLGSRNIE